MHARAYLVYQLGVAACNVRWCAELHIERCSCALCAFPAAACIATGVFALAYAVALGSATRAMAHAAINKRLRRRVLTFQAAALSCAPPDLALD